MKNIFENNELVPHLFETQIEPVQPRKKTNRKKKKTYEKWILVCLICLVVITGSVAVSIIYRAIAKTAKAANEAYYIAKDQTKNSIYQSFFDAAERKYHVSNNISITVDSLKEEAKLEVLKVSDVEYIIQEGTKENNGITSWLEVPGEGVFVVDLQVSEFIIDNEHCSVIARVPSPVLSECRIDYNNVVQLKYDNDLFNDSTKIGEDLARKQLQEADLLIKKEFNSNQRFFVAAKSAAETMIINLVTSFNPDVENLNVTVEFVD